LAENGVSQKVIRVLSDYYRIPEDSLGSVLVSGTLSETGFFRFGPETICYGQCASGVSSNLENLGRHDAFKDVQFNGTAIHLPFDPSQVIENLRRGRYEPKLMPSRERIVAREWVHKSYYFVREFLPISIRRHMQRAYFNDWRNRAFPAWPVDFAVDTLHERVLRLAMRAAGVLKVPFIWFWPDGAASCLIMTHDVETAAGRDFTSQLMDLDESFGFKASFQVIPEKRYEVPAEYLHEIQSRGFELNVHDLNHDGKLYRDKEEFLRRAKKINEYVRHYESRGFRAGAMYRMPDWYDAYALSYDMSVPNVAHLEPKRGGCCTVFPFFIGKILELPLTTTQDYSLFHILQDYSIDLWKTQVGLIHRRNGLISFIAHPDYLIGRRERKVYELLLDYLVQIVSREKIWSPLPREVDQWWRARSQMKLVSKDGGWQIEGPGSEHARIAYAVLEGDRLLFEIAGALDQQQVSG
jgi:hypothetical protein